MRRNLVLIIVLVVSLLGVGAYLVFIKGDATTNTPTTNVQGTIVNAEPNPGLILGVSPSKGAVAGGTKVTITGEGFRGTPKVLFGETEGKDVQVKGEKEITVTTPAGSKGLVDVVLKNSTGPTSSLQDGFTYE
ncbi:MAG: IPT/TIG domain-containing protein [Patescibacteria group bacterium]